MTSKGICQIRVYYEDTDLSGVVYHANYLRYFERARTEWLRDAGFSQEALKRDQGVVFAVANVSVDFIAPARLDDFLEVTTILKERRRASLSFVQTAAIVGEPARVLALATVRVACVAATTFRPRALPPIGLAQ